MPPVSEDKYGIKRYASSVGIFTVLRICFGCVHLLCHVSFYMYVNVHVHLYIHVYNYISCTWTYMYIHNVNCIHYT